MLTSANAVRALLPLIESSHLKEIPCFCISGNTAKEAKQAGLNLYGTAPDGLGLAENICKSPFQHVVHPTCSKHRTEASSRFAHEGIVYRPVFVYESTPNPLKYAPFQAFICFSPMQVSTFLELNRPEPETPAFCIGHSTAAALRAAGHTTIITATEPTVDSVLNSLFHYFHLQT